MPIYENFNTFPFVLTYPYVYLFNTTLELLPDERLIRGANSTVVRSAGSPPNSNPDYELLKKLCGLLNGRTWTGYEDSNTLKSGRWPLGLPQPTCVGCDCTPEMLRWLGLSPGANSNQVLAKLLKIISDDYAKRMRDVSIIDYPMGKILKLINRLRERLGLEGINLFDVIDLVTNYLRGNKKEFENQLRKYLKETLEALLKLDAYEISSILNTKLEEPAGDILDVFYEGPPYRLWLEREIHRGFGPLIEWLRTAPAPKIREGIGRYYEQEFGVKPPPPPELPRPRPPLLPNSTLPENNPVRPPTVPPNGPWSPEGLGVGGGLPGGRPFINPNATGVPPHYSTPL